MAKGDLVLTIPEIHTGQRSVSTCSCASSGRQAYPVKNGAGWGRVPSPGAIPTTVHCYVGKTEKNRGSTPHRGWETNARTEIGVRRSLSLAGINRNAIAFTVKC
jgi:hypothetical protein